MSSLIKPIIFRCMLLLLSLAFSVKSNASHIFGMDLYYTYVSGSTYKVSLAVYADCAGSAFFTLGSAAPVIDLYNGGTYINSTSLSIEAPTAGIEVTPVCPAQASNTTCINPMNPVPGVKKFVYSTNITLSGTSSVWRFLFSGRMGGSSTAGRSTSITNITIGTSGAPIQLVDTLNNTTSNNSSAAYTSIPTPFYCVNNTYNFNPGAVDPEGDLLQFSLVPGMDASTAGSVTYVWPFTATAPLATSSGSFAFSGTTGQISFFPNVVQKSLVVYNVRELRGGTLVGTSQREMTVVVLSPCTNTPPVASISSPSSGTVVSSTNLSVCNAVDSFYFSINPRDADGDTMDMSVTGLPAGATFDIVSNGTTSPTATFRWRALGRAPGTYTFYLHLKDRGCPIVSDQTIAYTVEILESPRNTVSIITMPSCTTLGRIQITPSGGSSPWLINILSGSSTVHIFSGVTRSFVDTLPPGTYTIRTYNTLFCTHDTIIALTAPRLPIVAVTAAPPTCPGTATGSISIRGGTGESTAFTYAIDTGRYTSVGDFSGLLAGTYLLHARDADGCVRDTLVSLSPPAPMLLSISLRKPICQGVNNGAVLINASGSVAPYTYAKNGGTYASSGLFDTLSSGTDTFHIKNGLGCVVDTIITLPDSVAFVGTLSTGTIDCHGGEAVVVLTAYGGYGGYTYGYDDATLGTFRIFNVPAGTYTFKIRDLNGCSFDSVATISEPPVLNLITATVSASCFGVADGRVLVSGTGGTPGYTYNVDGGTYSRSSTLSALTGGRHIVGIADTNGCRVYDTLLVPEPLPLVIDSFALLPPSCYGDTDGTITVYASGGTPTYTFALDSRAYGVSTVFAGIGAGTHTVYILDANGCMLDSTITTTGPSAVVPSVAVTSALCNTVANGAATISAAGGSPGYRYAYGSGSYSTTNSFGALAAGRHLLHVMDTTGCITDTTIVVGVINSIYGIFTVADAVCAGDSNGVISVIGAGGDALYMFSFMGGGFSDTNVFRNLYAATWSLSIKDSNGCIADTTVSIRQPNVMATFFTLSHPTCFGLADGSISVRAIGGTSPYRFSLGRGVFGSATAFSGLAAGTDTLIVIDTSGCRFDTIFSLTEPAELRFSSIVVSQISCFGRADGVITITGSGGTVPYSYSVDGGTASLASTFSALTAGRHLLSITDRNGCTADTVAVLTEPAAVVIDSIGIVAPTCTNNTDGIVTLFASGGAPPYQYSQDNFRYSTMPAIAKLPAGRHILYVRDSKGCFADTSLTLVGHPAITFEELALKQPTCRGSENGIIVVSAEGGTPPINYFLSGTYERTSANVFSSLRSGPYTLSVTDSANCRKDTTLFIVNPDTMVLAPTMTPNDCYGADIEGVVTVEVNGGVKPYSYLWAPDSSRRPFLASKANGKYRVYVTDNNGCKDSATVEITYNDCCTPAVPTAFSPNNDGKNDVFRITYKGDVRIVEFAVYNRYGQAVFSSSNSEEGWDGTYRGLNADMGTYFYYIRLLCGNKQSTIMEFKGDVTLVR
jgi:gliding motility-associated-like protein